jgi:hypothetical protein
MSDEFGKQEQKEVVVHFNENLYIQFEETIKTYK